MLRLADVVRVHGPAYVERHGASMLPSHARALQSIVRCRTPESGGHAAVCSACGVEHLLYHSCGHRACPRCGGAATTRWIGRQRSLLLHASYFHVVFTLPAELRRLVRSHQRTLLPVLFQAAFESLSILTADPRYLGARIGALAVLHTWSRTLEWHPHVHLLVPGGGVADDGTWREVPRRKQRYLVPVKALAKLFRGRFLDLARRALRATPGAHIPSLPRDQRWVVFAKPAVQGADKILEYLGRYIHKTAIADGSLVACDDRTATFRYLDHRDGRRKTMTLPGAELLRRFLQHVLPRGLHRVRAFGLLHPSQRSTLRRLQLLLAPRASVIAAPQPSTRRHIPCPHCQRGTLKLVGFLSPAACLERAASTTTLPGARAPPAMSAPIEASS